MISAGGAEALWLLCGILSHMPKSAAAVASTATLAVRPEPAFDPDVDAYIAKAAPFAQPILTHVRALVHSAVPGVVEEMKWSRPFFVYSGIILGNVAAFKAHCSVGLWGEDVAAKLRDEGWLVKQAMGSLGRIAALEQLPSDDEMIAYWKLGAEAIDAGDRTVSYRRPQRVAKAEVPVPEELSAALGENAAAKKVFDDFPPSCRREYNEWIADAKRSETRAKRVAQTIEWLAMGKRRNWKHESR